MLGLNDIFYISSVIFFVTIPLIWITKPALSAGSANASNAHESLPERPMAFMPLWNFSYASANSTAIAAVQA
jgi:hypothetical protein